MKRALLWRSFFVPVFYLCKVQAHKVYLFLLALLITRGAFAQNKEICVLDLTKKNAETTEGNLFSVQHLLKCGGFSYFVTDSVNLAIQSKIILPTSNIEDYTFSQPERDSISDFVSNGGILIATNIKDTLLYVPFGVTSTLFNSNRFFIRFNTDYDSLGIFSMFDDPFEKEIRLGDTADYATCINSRAFTISTADTLATYETGEVAISHKAFGTGHTYLTGIQYKELILRAQVKKDYGASRVYSNGFEPAQDVYVFFIAGIIKKHLQHVVYKHSAPCNFRSALVLTHDVDATSSMEMFDDYASYEKLNNIRSTYLITTHYMHDRLAKDFYDGFEDVISRVYEMGHNIQSHSVSHMPDFDNLSRVPIGSNGNNRNNYQPYYDGSKSSNVTVFGECEVSRDLLEGLIPEKVTCFRPGYLAFHDSLINVLSKLNYKFSSSHSANDVMTHFPFFSHTDKDMSGRLTDVLEIPNTISDVFSQDPITEQNFYSKVDIWKSCFYKAYNNNTNTVLLIHPTRYYKLYAEQLLINQLPQDAVISNIEEYGEYWLNRDGIEFQQMETNGTLTILLNRSLAELNESVSFIVNNGRDFNQITLLDKDSVVINYYQDAWNTNDVIIYAGCERPAYNNFQIGEKPKSGNVYIYPNPSTDNDLAFLHFSIMEESKITISIYDITGKLLFEMPESKQLNLGPQDIQLSIPDISNGTYVVRLFIGGDGSYNLKWVVARP